MLGKNNESKFTIEQTNYLMYNLISKKDFDKEFDFKMNQISKKNSSLK